MPSRENARNGTIKSGQSRRRRGLDPLTCHKDYSPDEREFIDAIDRYKREAGRMFPTWSEALEVLVGLGYSKRPAGTAS